MENCIISIEKYDFVTDLNNLVFLDLILSCTPTCVCSTVCSVLSEYLKKLHRRLGRDTIFFFEIFFRLLIGGIHTCTIHAPVQL